MYVVVDKKTLKPRAIYETDPEYKRRDTDIIYEPNLTVTDIELITVELQNGQYVIKTKTLNEYKTEKIKEVQNRFKIHIERFYPEIKQRSDIADKEYYGSWLISNVEDVNGNPAYTTDILYQRAFVYGQQIWLGSKNLSQILSDLQTNELPNLQPTGIYGGTRTAWEQEFLFAWEQLIKIAVRVAFVQACKNIYRRIRTKIEQAQTVQDIRDIKAQPLNMPVLPEDFR